MTPGLFSCMVTLPCAKRPKSFADEFARGDPGFLGGLHQSIAVFGQFCMKMKKIGARILLCRSATGLSLFICKFAMCSFKSKNCRFPVPISIPPLHPRSTRFKGSLLIMQKSVTGSVVHHINLILLHG